MNGNLFVLSAPSGAGKSSLVKTLVEDDPGVSLSISYTTRPPRPGEKNGREYHFVDSATFQAMCERGEFLESAEVHDYRYGTSQSWIEKTLAAARDVILEIDWQGARQIRQSYPNAVSVFVLPPSMEDLERRLRARGQDDEEVIKRRMKNAAEELGHACEFDYVIINKEFEEARRDLGAIVRASRLTLAKQSARYPEQFQLTGRN